MSIQSLCHGSVVTADKHLTLRRAAELMESRCIGSLVITSLDSNSKPIGILTDRDLVIKAVATGMDLDSETVESIMSTDLVTVIGSAELGAVIQLMEERGVRRMIVLDDDGQVRGLFTVEDLVRAVANAMNQISQLFFGQTGTPSRHVTHEYTRMA